MVNGAYLPPLRSLRVFEAAARQVRFTKAAAELNISQGAVSQQIRGLEERIGFDLFVRRPHRLLLTDEGRSLATAVAAALTIMAESIAALRGGRSESVKALHHKDAKRGNESDGYDPRIMHVVAAWHREGRARERV
jgi:DNA-binding MarR family transcriptional regulator